MSGVFGKASAYLSFTDMSRVVTRREAFMNAFWAGLGAPAMLYGATAGYMLYDANAGLKQAWGDVGQKMNIAVRDGSVARG